jgi:hypothetical protein
MSHGLTDADFERAREFIEHRDATGDVDPEMLCPRARSQATLTDFGGGE